jgi:hypothetical protein
MHSLQGAFADNFAGLSFLLLYDCNRQVTLILDKLFLSLLYFQETCLGRTLGFTNITLRTIQKYAENILRLKNTQPGIILYSRLGKRQTVQSLGCVLHSQ